MTRNTGSLLSIGECNLKVSYDRTNCFHRAIVNVNVIYVHDSHVFRVFLARADMFPPGSVLPAVPGSIPALINPALLGNAASIPAANSSVNPRVEPVRNTTVKHAKILRPPNAFILYRKAHHEAVKAAHPGIHNNEICKHSKFYLTYIY
jgi:hypothetical protein